MALQDARKRVKCAFIPIGSVKCQLRGLTGSTEVRVEKREKQVDKQIINYVNDGGVQRFCLFLGV